MPALHHIALGAHDVEAVARFYREVFGLPEVKRHLDDAGALRSIWLDLEGPLLMVERSTEDRPRVEGVGRGPFLLAFAVDPAGRSHFEAAIRARGGTLEAQSTFSSYARDPEGNRIAVSHYPTPGPA